MAGLQFQLLWKQANKKISAARQRQDGRKKEASKHRAEKKILVDSNYLQIEESTVHINFRVRVMPFAGTVVTAHTICEGLSRE